MALQTGDLLANRYQIEAEIGTGGFGRVYRAYDNALNRTVAIKATAKEEDGVGSSEYAERSDRFQQESELQANLNHSHIAQVYDLVRLPPNRLYLVMEYVDGGNLRDLFQKEKEMPLSPLRTAEIGEQIASALIVVHDHPQSIVHRDIKPANILLTAQGEVKLSDFGVAQVGDLSMRTFEPKPHPGTHRYASPEQRNGGGYLEPASDIYSLGTVLFEAVTGQNFYRYNRTRPTEIMQIFFCKKRIPSDSSIGYWGCWNCG